MRALCATVIMVAECFRAALDAKAVSFSEEEVFQVIVFTYHVFNHLFVPIIDQPTLVEVEARVEGPF